MLDTLLTEAVFAERYAMTLQAIYRKQWYEFRALEKLEARLRLSRERLGLPQKEVPRVHRDATAARLFQS